MVEMSKDLVEELRRQAEQATMEFLTKHGWDFHERTATTFEFWSKQTGDKHLGAFKIDEAFELEMKL